MKYVVSVTPHEVQFWTVEAESEEEAMENYMGGNYYGTKFYGEDTEIVHNFTLNTIDAEYEQAVADAEANEKPRQFKQLEGKKWTGNRDYMNDYIPPTDIKDIGKV